MPKLDPKALKEARKAKYWTRNQLSEATKINISTIFRLESGKSESVREHTLKQLARALAVDESDLCEGPELKQDLLKVDINAFARNALMLVAQRYRINEEQIVEAAPLLFYIAAEQSLKDRQRRVTELRAAAKSLSDLQAGIPHLPHNSPIDEAALGREERAINERDLLGDSFFDKNHQFLGNPDDEFSEADGPFSVYLRKALATASSQQEDLDAVSWPSDHQGPSYPYYQICRDEAAKLVGGDEMATDAILSGFVELRDGEMPESPQELAAEIRTLLDGWRATVDRTQTDISDEMPAESSEASATEDDDEDLPALTEGTVH